MSHLEDNSGDEGNRYVPRINKNNNSLKDIKLCESCGSFPPHESRAGKCLLLIELAHKCISYQGLIFFLVLFDVNFNDRDLSKWFMLKHATDIRSVRTNSISIRLCDKCGSRWQDVR